MGKQHIGCCEDGCIYLGETKTNKKGKTVFVGKKKDVTVDVLTAVVNYLAQEMEKEDLPSVQYECEDGHGKAILMFKYVQNERDGAYQ